MGEAAFGEDDTAAGRDPKLTHCRTSEDPLTARRFDSLTGVSLPASAEHAMMVEVGQSSTPRSLYLDGAPDGLTLVRLTAIIEGSNAV